MSDNQPNQDADFYLNRGWERRTMGLYRAAVQDFETSCRLLPPSDPRLPQIRFAIAMSLLYLEDWKHGWDAYECRFDYTDIASSAIANYRDRSTPWDGGDIRGRSLVVLAEQGLGDVLQFCRYILPLARTGAHVYFVCYPPLIRLMQQSFPTLRIIPNTTLIEADFYIPLLSLPRLLRPQVGEKPYCPDAYLYAAPERVTEFRQKLDRLAPERRRFGVAWSGNPQFANDIHRSVPPHLIAALLTVDADFFTIQPDRDLAPFRELGIHNLHDLSADLQDFTDTAALMIALDGVVSVDTSVIHLAGGLCRPSWLLLPANNDWRWGANNTSPWYPSIHIARQQTAGDWTLPLLTVARDLVQFVPQLPCPTT